MGNLVPLKKKFGPNKRFTRLVAVRKPCPLGFKELVVYSTVIFRAKNTGLSARRISLLTGFHQRRRLWVYRPNLSSPACDGNHNEDCRKDGI